jgi:hypothetical protein
MLWFQRWWPSTTPDARSVQGALAWGRERGYGSWSEKGTMWGVVTPPRLLAGVTPSAGSLPTLRTRLFLYPGTS